jgi:hypothetical protein
MSNHADKGFHSLVQMTMSCVVLAALVLIVSAIGWQPFADDRADVNLDADNSTLFNTESAQQNTVEPPVVELDNRLPDLSINLDQQERHEIDQRFVDPSCPVPLPKASSSANYTRTSNIETWKLTSDLSCASYAQTVLQILQPTGTELIHAGYLDLSGQCWGCVIRTADDESIIISLLPQSIFSDRNESNPLEVTVIRMLAPEEVEE